MYKLRNILKQMQQLRKLLVDVPSLTLIVFVVRPAAQFHAHAVADDRVRLRAAHIMGLLVAFAVLLRVRLSVGDSVVVGGRRRQRCVLDGSFLFRLGFLAHDLVLGILEERPDPYEGDLRLVGLGVFLLDILKGRE